MIVENKSDLFNELRTLFIESDYFLVFSAKKIIFSESESITLSLLKSFIESQRESRVTEVSLDECSFSSAVKEINLHLSYKLGFVDFDICEIDESTKRQKEFWDIVSALESLPPLKTYEYYYSLESQNDLCVYWNLFYIFENQNSAFILFIGASD